MTRIVTPLLTLLLLLSSVSVDAQKQPAPKKSPVAIAKAQIGNAYVKIVYGQPSKNNRVIFGELVPFGKVWRLGANESTEITLTSDVLIGTTKVPAGTYSLFAIPEKNEWTLIINKDLGMWGDYSYKAENDVVRIKAPIAKNEPASEAFIIEIAKVEETFSLTFYWDDVKVSIPIKAVN